MRKLLLVAGIILSCGPSVICGQGTSATPGAVTPANPASPLDALRFLVGTWQGEGSGQPGHGGGWASFKPDLDGRVLVRRNHSEYPATSGKPGVVHDDLMVVYPAPGTRRLEAVYFDNEGHVIEYSVDVAPDGGRVVLVSEEEPATPRFRLTYTKVADDVVDVAFEIAPPGAPTAFKPYGSGRTRRTGRE